jgi:hypothetical protein
MAADLVKLGRNDQSLVRVSPARQAMTNALARLRQSGEIVTTNSAQRIVVPPPSPASGAIIDLPRICAVHDKPYTARYIADRKGKFHYGQSIRVDEKRICQQYEANLGNVLTLPAHDADYETCPWCGAYGFGSIRCDSCRTEVCYGRTHGNDFHCRPSCGSGGRLSSDNRSMRGLTPSLPPNSAPGSGGR